MSVSRVAAALVVATLCGAASRTSVAGASDAIADLVPGGGFSAPTGEPPRTGHGRGADAKVIARWDVVPYQTFAGKLPAGVVAFHMAGIDRVEFSANGGPWTAVREMTLNPVTGIWEYDANVDAATLSDGAVEIRAVAYPKVGLPRVLAGPFDTGDRSLVSGEYSLVLSANGKGTLPSASLRVAPTGDDARGDGSAERPLATIAGALRNLASSPGAAEGATIWLSPGDYAYPDPRTIPATSTRWLTIVAVPGAVEGSVRITRADTNTSPTAHSPGALVHLKDLTLHGVEIGDGGEPGLSRVWADACVLEGAGPLDPTRFFQADQWRGGIFVTDCKLRNVKYPAYGHALTRNTVVTDVGGDAFREPAGLIARCEVKRLVNMDDTHNDVVQFWDPAPRRGVENVIVYGLKAVEDITAQALFVQQYGPTVRYDNFAFVNFLVCAPYGAQWQNPGKHLLLWNVEILSPPGALAANKGGFMFCDVTGGPARPTSVRDVSLRNCVLQRFNALQTGAEPDVADPSWADNNHFLDVASHMSSAPGTNATSGGVPEALFRDALHGDFTPAAKVLLRRVDPLLVPVDVSGRALATPAAVGACGSGK